MKWWKILIFLPYAIPILMLMGLKGAEGIGGIIGFVATLAVAFYVAIGYTILLGIVLFVRWIILKITK